jgi:hypothetical protein
VTIAPDHGDGVVALGFDFGGEDVFGDGPFVQDVLSAHLVDAERTFALDPERAGVDPLLDSIRPGEFGVLLAHDDLGLARFVAHVGDLVAFQFQGVALLVEVRRDRAEHLRNGVLSGQGEHYRSTGVRELGYVAPQRHLEAALDAELLLDHRDVAPPEDVVLLVRRLFLQIGLFEIAGLPCFR